MSEPEIYRKLAVVGDLGCGKTELVRTISEVAPVNTDVKSSIDIGKELTTVGIDYGRIHLDESTALGVYGVPGQSRYSFVWDMVKPSIWGIVVLVKAGSDQERARLEKWIDHFEIVENRVACVVGITHSDSVSPDVLSTTMDGVDETISGKQLSVPILPIDARSHDDAVMLLAALNAMAGSQ